MIDLPPKLKNKKFKFIPLNGKIPIEKEWQRNNNYSYDDSKLEKHEGNLGILTGHNNLLVIDFDDKIFQEMIYPLLPKTFSVRTGSGGIHCYYSCEDAKNLKILNKNKETLADFQFIGKQVVSPGSIHPDTKKKYEVIEHSDIKEIKFDQIKIIFDEYLPIEEKVNIQSRAEKNSIVDEIKSKISLKQLLDEYGYNTSRNPTMCKLGHPSKGGHCFSFCDELYNCFHCGSKGDIFNLVMSHENVDFKGALKILADKVGVELDQKGKLKIIPKYFTFHIPYFKEVRRITQLIGKEYIPIVKLLFRQLISLAINQDVVEVCDVYTDRRIHSLYPMGSGDGKRNIKYATKLIGLDLKKIIAEPSSIHSEQFIGKVIERKKRAKQDVYVDYPSDIICKVAGSSVFLMNKGYLADDVLQLEEAMELLTNNKDKDLIQCRDKLCQGLDPIGRNEITKRSVDNLRGEEVRYNPCCITQGFLQKYHLPEEVVLKGLLRRFLIPFISLPFEGRDYDKKWEASDDFHSAIDVVVNYLKEIQQITKEKKFEFTPDALDSFKKCHKSLVSYGVNFSPKCYNFTKISDWTLQEFLLKFAVNVAASCFTNIVNKEIVEIAFMDLLEQWDLTLNYIDQKIMGTLDYGEKYGGANFKERILLDWLVTKGALSFESSDVSIADFLEEVKKVFGTDSDSTARNKYYAMKSKGVIDSKQGSKTLTRVWATFNPQISQGAKGAKGYIRYSEICKNLKNKLSSIKPLQPLTPLKIKEERVPREDLRVSLFEFIKCNPENNAKSLHKNFDPSFIEKLENNGDIVEMPSGTYRIAEGIK